eukprot:3779694-Alexandrium_andersonii.AAC.1
MLAAAAARSYAPRVWACSTCLPWTAYTAGRAPRSRRPEPCPPLQRASRHRSNRWTDPSEAQQHPDVSAKVARELH